MIKLFLDDIREPINCLTLVNKNLNYLYYEKDWVIVRTYKDFVNYIETNGLPELISFDHDLGDVPQLKTDKPIDYWFDLDNNKEYTGYDCAKWLVNYCLDFNLQLPTFIVHSANPIGKKNIESLLINFKKHENKTIAKIFHCKKGFI